jgi:hypothetical protein
VPPVVLRLGQKEVAALRAGTVPSTVLDKIGKAEARKESSKAQLSTADAIEAFHEVLGRDLIKPLATASHGWWGQMGRKMAEAGYTRDDCIVIAKVVKAKGWKGVRVETLIRGGERYLAEAQLGLPFDAGSSINRQLEEMDEL